MVSISRLCVAVLGAFFAPMLVSQDPVPVAPATPKLMRAKHILIPWKGSPADAAAELTQEQAKEKAEELLARLKAGEGFSELAKSESSCPSKATGGYLGHFRSGNMVPEFEKALTETKVGEVAGPVKTQFGWHLILPMKPIEPWPQAVDVAHILISHKDAQGLGSSMTRSKEEAHELATEIRAKLAENPSKFDDLAREHSDDKGSGARGGAMGMQPPERFVAPFAEAAVVLKIGAISEPVETPFGYHIIKRNPGPMGARHILIPWKGSQNAPADVSRSKEEARKLVDEILATLNAKADAGPDFAGLARTHSSCPSSAKGGDLGMFGPGQMVPAFEKAVVESKVGQVVGPVETPFGYHIIERTQ